MLVTTENNCWSWQRITGYQLRELLLAKQIISAVQGRELPLVKPENYFWTRQRITVGKGREITAGNGRELLLVKTDHYIIQDRKLLFIKPENYCWSWQRINAGQGKELLLI